LYRLLRDEGPWNLVAGLYVFAPTAGDAALLERIGAIAHSGGAAFVAGASGRFSQRLSTDEEEAWYTIRKSPAAPAVGLVWPRFVLRLPYGRKTSSTDLLEFEEMPDQPQHEEYLWGNPAVAAACLFRGPQRELAGLPVHTWRDSDGEPQMKPCAEAWLTEEQALRLLGVGVMPLVSIKGRDAVRLLRFQSIAEPPTLLE
jgi:type VI secretion system protein ImpC